jgi:hypothetical protein
MKKTLLTLFSTFVLLNFTNAQVNAYPFAQTSGTYAPITGGTVLGDTSLDEQRFVDPAVPAGGTTTSGVGFPIGFNFTFNGLVFDKLAINTNGWISLGQSSLTPSVNMASGSSYTLVLSQTSTATPPLLRNRIAGFAMDLDAQTGSELRIETIGSTPNRVCVIQWKKFRKYSFTNNIGDDINFQIRLSETLNKVEVVYGTMTSNVNSAAPQVGLSGTTNADFNIRTTTTNWSSTSAGTVNTDVCSFSASVKPSSGQTYTWTFPTACTGAPTAGTVSAPTNICDSVSFNLSLTGYSTGVTGLTFQWQSSLSGGSYANITNGTTPTFPTLQTAATYYKCIVTCTGSSQSTTTTPVNITMTPTRLCYCSATNASSSCITNVTLNTLNHSSAGCENSPNYYTSVPVTTATTSLNKGQTYPLSVSIDNSAEAILSVWIDYNQNGIFDSTEWHQIADTALVSSTSTVSVLIPNSALTGLTGMRIRSRNSGAQNGAADACLAMFSGETEDYVISIAVYTGIAENTLTNISVFPNPSTGLFNITAGNANFSELTISILDIQGKEVFHALEKNHAAEFNKQINLDGLAKGFYTIKLNTSTGFNIQKLIIQ